MKDFIKPLEITAFIVSLLVISYLFSYTTLPDFKRDTIEIITKDGARYSMNVELAVSNKEKSFGLMYRNQLPQEIHGMLFIYQKPQPVSMWMKNTNLFLDMLFIKENGKIVKIVRNAVPGSTQPIPSGEPVKAVLELKAGVADRFDVGDIAIHKIFNNVEKEPINLPF